MSPHLNPKNDLIDAQSSRCNKHDETKMSHTDCGFDCVVGIFLSPPSRRRLQIKRRVNNLKRHMHMPLVIPFHQPPFDHCHHILMHALHIAFQSAMSFQRLGLITEKSCAGELNVKTAGSALPVFHAFLNRSPAACSTASSSQRMRMMACFMSEPSSCKLPAGNHRSVDQHQWNDRQTPCHRGGSGRPCHVRCQLQQSSNHPCPSAALSPSIYLATST
jgi:hypothetical protein